MLLLSGPVVDEQIMGIFYLKRAEMAKHLAHAERPDAFLIWVGID